MSRRVRVVATVLGVAVLSFTAGYAAQTHMDNALAALQTARGELQVAEHNKGGHRVNAIRRGPGHQADKDLGGLFGLALDRHSASLTNRSKPTSLRFTAWLSAARRRHAR